MLCCRVPRRCRASVASSSYLALWLFCTLCNPHHRAYTAQSHSNPYLCRRRYAALSRAKLVAIDV